MKEYSRIELEYDGDRDDEFLEIEEVEVISINEIERVVKGE